MAPSRSSVSVGVAPGRHDFFPRRSPLVLVRRIQPKKASISSSARSFPVMVKIMCLRVREAKMAIMAITMRLHMNRLGVPKRRRPSQPGNSLQVIAPSFISKYNPLRAVLPGVRRYTYYHKFDNMSIKP